MVSGEKTGNSGKRGSPARVMGLFTLAMINVAAVLSVRNYPSMAEFGWSSVGWYVTGTAIFLIPISLAGAELATGWPEGGGIYAWVRQAFGERGGFIALFCEWSNNLFWFPTVLAFIASTLAFALTPGLAQNPLYMFSVMMIVFWGTTAISWFGTAATVRLSNIGVVFGSIIPSILIIAFGTWWITAGSTNALPAYSPEALLPTISPATIPFFSTIILLFTGMEMAGFHALSTRDPQRDYPRAIALSAVIILMCTILGTLAIAFVIPAGQLSLASGVMQAIQFFFAATGISWLVAPMAVLIALGGVALLAAWLIGPAQGLYVVARDGNLPPLFHRKNRYGAPIGILLIQASIGSFVSLLYIFLPSINQAYWLLSAVSTEVLCIVYFFVFAALIRLRYTQPDVPRSFKIPGGKAGAWLVAGTGMAGVIFAFIVGLMPPALFEQTASYVVVVLCGTLVLALPPLVFMKFRKPHWKLDED
jgi:amino acid transporter